METTSSLMPLWACLSSLLAVIPIVVFGQRAPHIREGATLLAGALQLAFVAVMVRPITEGKVIQCTLFEALPSVPIEFRVDGLGLLFALVASILWIPTSIYAIGYMRTLKEHSQTRFYAFFAVSLCATLGVAFAGNLLTLYLFYELLSLSTYPLVTHHQNAEARSGGRKYLAHLMGTSIGFLLPAMIYSYLKTGGDLTFSPGGFLAGSVGGTEALIVLLLFLFGFAKAGLMPFHSWLPGAMVAPTPVSALLHAVAVVKAGVFCILRVITGVFGTGFLEQLNLGQVMGWIAAFTVVVSSLIALTQDNLKRRLAFSTIGQLAYIVLGASLLNVAGLTGSLFHLVTHAFGKITLFFCAGAIYVASGKTKVSELNGIGRAMPLTMAAFAIGALSVTGLPPTSGFLSKFNLLIGCAQADRIALLVVFLVSTLLNAAYFAPILIRAYFQPGPPSKKGARKIHEAPWLCVVPLLFTALVALALFFENRIPMALIKAFLP